MSITINDTTWYVFTRDNIKHNSELEDLGVSYESVYDLLYNNEAYMDAIQYQEDGEYIELFVRKRTIDSSVVNLSNYSNDDALEFAKGLGERQKTNDYSVHETQYKFAKLKYTDANSGYYVCEFVTFVNKDNYTFTFQSPTPFSDSNYDEIEAIIDSIQFDIDASLKEPKPITFWDKVWDKAITQILGGVVMVGVVCTITFIEKRKKKNNKDNANP